MRDFDWTSFTKRIYINTELKQVYDAITTISGLEKWLLSECELYTELENKLTPNTNVEAGQVYSWRWFAQNHAEKGKIIKANGSDAFEFSFAGDCLVKIQLTTVHSQTLLELTQRNIPTDDGSKESIRLGCDFGWTFYLTNLKSILEGGIDLRNKDTSLVGVVNN